MLNWLNFKTRSIFPDEGETISIISVFIAGGKPDIKHLLLPGIQKLNACHFNINHISGDKNHFVGFRGCRQ